MTIAAKCKCGYGGYCNGRKECINTIPIYLPVSTSPADNREKEDDFRVLFDRHYGEGMFDLPLNISPSSAKNFFKRFFKQTHPVAGKEVEEFCNWHRISAIDLCNFYEERLNSAVEELTEDCKAEQQEIDYSEVHERWIDESSSEDNFHDWVNKHYVIYNR